MKGLKEREYTMSDLSKKMENIIKEIEEKISNPEECEFVKEKIAQTSLMHISIIEKMTELIAVKLEEIDRNQNLLNDKIERIEDSLNGIESNIYDDDYECEIVCPYCNNQFVADIELNSEIRCPECNNIIELEWKEDDK